MPQQFGVARGVEEEEMKASTRKDLKKSVAHWKRLSLGKGRKGEWIGGSWCALCQKFNHKGAMLSRLRCVGCPVHAHTGRQFCEGTPHDKMRDFVLWRLESKKRISDSEFRNLAKFRKIAKEEYEFLKGLLQ